MFDWLVTLLPGAAKRRTPFGGGGLTGVSSKGPLSECLKLNRWLGLMLPYILLGQGAIPNGYASLHARHFTSTHAGIVAVRSQALTEARPQKGSSVCGFIYGKIAFNLVRGAGL